MGVCITILVFFGGFVAGMIALAALCLLAASEEHDDGYDLPRKGL